MLGTTILEERTSKYNGSLRVVRSWGLGTYIQSDGLTQSGGVVEDFWKQTLRKVKSKGLKVKDVLILGLGGGTVAKLVRKIWPDAKITGIEIDPIMVSLGKKYLDLDKYNVDIKICDANNYSLITNRYDLVIVDTYFGDKFVDLSKMKLNKSKIVVFNRLYYKDKKSEAEKFGEKLKKIFKNVEVFRPITNLMYICSN